MSMVKASASLLVSGDVFNAVTDIGCEASLFYVGVLHADDNTIFIYDMEAAVSLAKAASEIVRQFAAREAAKTETTTEGGERDGDD